MCTLSPGGHYIESPTVSLYKIRKRHLADGRGRGSQQLFGKADGGLYLVGLKPRYVRVRPAGPGGTRSVIARRAAASAVCSSAPARPSGDKNGKAHEEVITRAAMRNRNEIDEERR